MNKEKCLLVGLETYNNNKIEGEIKNDINELSELVKADEGIVISSIIQKRFKQDSKYYVGKGKIEEIAIYADELEIDTIVINDELTGSQINNIEKVVGIKVVDRTMIILDIFAKRALTKEGKLQVELAQLKYRLPRLKGLGKTLSRQGGGIGTRGPGEKKIETDRRHILRRIKDIELQLAKVEKIRSTKRKYRLRDEASIVSIVGYTNAGKSTLLNALLDAVDNKDNKKVFCHNMLFATLETELRKIKLPGGKEAIFSDTVGFVKKLPTHLIEAFKGTLEEIKYADIILHVLDINDENLLANKKTTIDIINNIISEEIPIINVYNKIDISEHLYDNDKINADTVYISAKNKINIDDLLEMADNRLNGNKLQCKMKIPYNKLEIYHNLYNKRKILKVEHKEQNIYVDVVIYELEQEKYIQYISEVRKIG